MTEVSITDIFPMKKRRLSTSKTPTRRQGSSVVLGRLRKTPRRIALLGPSNVNESGPEIMWDNNSPSPGRSFKKAQGKRTETGAKKEKEISAMIKKLSRNKRCVIQDDESSNLMKAWMDGGKQDLEQEKQPTQAKKLSLRRNPTRQSKKMTQMTRKTPQRVTRQRSHSTRQGSRFHEELMKFMQQINETEIEVQAKKNDNSLIDVIHEEQCNTSKVVKDTSQIDFDALSSINECYLGGTELHKPVPTEKNKDNSLVEIDDDDDIAILEIADNQCDSLIMDVEEFTNGEFTKGASQKPNKDPEIDSLITDIETVERDRSKIVPHKSKKYSQSDTLTKDIEIKMQGFTKLKSDESSRQPVNDVLGALENMMDDVGGVLFDTVILTENSCFDKVHPESILNPVDFPSVDLELDLIEDDPLLELEIENINTASVNTNLSVGTSTNTKQRTVDNTTKSVDNITKNVDNITMNVHFDSCFTKNMDDSLLDLDLNSIPCMNVKRYSTSQRQPKVLPMQTRRGYSSYKTQTSNHLVKPAVGKCLVPEGTSNNYVSKPQTLKPSNKSVLNNITLQSKAHVRNSHSNQRQPIVPASSQESSSNFSCKPQTIEPPVKQVINKATLHNTNVQNGFKLPPELTRNLQSVRLSNRTLNKSINTESKATSNDSRMKLNYTRQRHDSRDSIKNVSSACHAPAMPFAKNAVFESNSVGNENLLLRRNPNNCPEKRIPKPAPSGLIDISAIIKSPSSGQMFDSSDDGEFLKDLNLGSETIAEQPITSTQRYTNADIERKRLIAQQKLRDRLKKKSVMVCGNSRVPPLTKVNSR